MKTLTHQPIPVTSPSQDFDEMYISASVENEYVETAYVNSIAGPTIKVCLLDYYLFMHNILLI